MSSRRSSFTPSVAACLSCNFKHWPTEIKSQRSQQHTSAQPTNHHESARALSERIERTRSLTIARSPEASPRKVTKGNEMQKRAANGGRPPLLEIAWLNQPGGVEKRSWSNPSALHNGTWRVCISNDLSHEKPMRGRNQGQLRRGHGAFLNAGNPNLT